MHIQVITLFPQMFASITESGVTARAHQQHLWQFNAINPRQFADNPLGYIDDRPFGGGPGMVMMAPPLQAAIEAAQAQCPEAQLIYMSPQGQPLNHAMVASLSKQKALTIICGRYEGIDERVLQCNDVLEISIGDYVVSGGELPAMVLMDAVLRLIPGVLGDQQSAQEDSFVHGLLDHPQYTKPAIFNNIAVPEVLRHGNHALIAQWRAKQSLRRTLTRRPDLLDRHVLTKEESRLLQEIQQEERDIQ